MRRFLLLASALVALAVLSAAGAATAKVPPKHKRTSHAAAKAAVKKPAKAKPAARAKAKPRHTVVLPTAAAVVDEDDDQVEDQAEDVDNRGPGNAEDDQGVDVDNSGPGNDDLDDDNSGPGSSHSGHGGGGGDDTAAVEAATTSAVEPLSCRGRPDGAAAARTAEIFERHGPTVLGLCRMLLRNEHEAEDASQQTFLAAYRSIRNGVEPRHPAAWLATIARNECWAAIERRMREPFHQGELESRLPDPVVQAAANADLEELWRAIGELPRQQRRALLLREFSGLTYAELAGALGVTEPAVESLLVRARRELRGRLRPLSGSAAALAAPLGALRDALARLVLGMPDAPAASGLAKLAAGAAAAVVAGGTVGAIETHGVGREVGTPPADAAVAPGAVTLPAVRPAVHARRTNPPARVTARPVSRQRTPGANCGACIADSRRSRPCLGPGRPNRSR